MPGSEVQELGSVLREARERKGVTLADAQQATKIRLSFLQALESEDFSVLPPPFYIRGFIKTYAVYLNLDPRSTVQLFDEILDGVHSSRMAERQASPSADSGSRAIIPLDGLSQAEADQVANSNERLNLRALPPPSTNLVSGQRRSTGFNQAFEDSPADGFGAGYSPRKPGTLGYNDKYVLKQVMLPSAKGSFYMPNFVPTLLVIVIILAAALLIYRGISNQPKDTSAYEAAASATITAGGYAGPYAITPDPTLSSVRATITAGAGNATSSVMKPPAYYTPDASIQALDRTPTTANVGGVAGTNPGTSASSTVSGTKTVVPAFGSESSTPGSNVTAPAATTVAPPAATATAVPPTATPIPTPVTVVVTVSSADPAGSWMTITVDDKQVLAKVMGAGESLTFTGNKVAVMAGKPDNVKVTVNGQDKQYTTPNSGLVTHTWFADGHDTIVKV